MRSDMNPEETNGVTAATRDVLAHRRRLNALWAMLRDNTLYQPTPGSAAA
jgi:hypothetical protein